jgi:hypothetical protein
MGVAVQKTQPQNASGEKEVESMLSFIPAGLGRSVAEYLVALIPGSVLLFVFYLAAESGVLFLGSGKSDLLAASFIPVICILPVLCGVVATLVLEKLRKKPLTLQRGATVGAAAGLAGALVSVLMLAVIALLFSDKYPLGETVGKGILFYVVLLVVLVIETVLGALGGALVVKFIKEA